MFASCGDVEFDGGNLSARGTVVVRLSTEDALIACCWSTASGSGCFPGLPLFLRPTGGAGFGVMLDGVRGNGGMSGAWLVAPFIHDLMCFLPSARFNVLAVAFASALWASPGALGRAPAVIVSQRGGSHDEKRRGGYASIAARAGERYAVRR